LGGSYIDAWTLNVSNRAIPFNRVLPMLLKIKPVPVLLPRSMEDALVGMTWDRHLVYFATIERMFGRAATAAAAATTF
jgi:hypothetical protein